MTTLYTMRHVRTGEVVAIDSFAVCTGICEKANSITGLATYQVVRSTFAEMAEYGTKPRKPIFTLGASTGLEHYREDDPYDAGHRGWQARERPKYVYKTVKDKVAEYLAKFIKPAAPAKKKLIKIKKKKK